jgi:diguanylate cyclase (GGDEF)-like protein
MKIVRLRTKILLIMVSMIMLSTIAIIIFIKTALYQELIVKLQKRGISIARQIRDGSINYILTEKFFELEMMIKDFKITEEDVEYIFILNEHGEVLGHTFEKGFPMSMKSVNMISAGQTHSVEPIKIEEKDTEKDILDIAVPILGGEAGVVHLGISRDFIEKDVNDIVMFMIWMITGIMMAGIIAAIILSKIITKPVSELTKAVKVVGSGNLNYSVYLSTNDEIGQLSESFNKMTRDLKQRTDELQKANSDLSILYAVSTAAGSTMKLDELFEAVLYIIANLEIFKLEYKGAVFTIDGDRVKLVYQTGFPDSFVTAHKDMKVGECICGLAAQTGEIIVSKSSETDIRHTIKYAGIISHGHISIPLETRNRVLGVLCLYPPVGIEVNEHEMALFYTIGNRIGAAIDNIMLYEETKTLSLHDPLTGLANRRLMDYVLETSFARAKRAECPFSAIMLDIDSFKNYNDKYGHTVGDKMLIDIAKIVSREIRQIDLGVRYGGEEFLILLPETGLSEACEVAERMRKDVEAKTGVTVSLGITCYNHNMLRKEEIISKADDALLEAKRKGKNRIEVNAQT